MRRSRRAAALVLAGMLCVGATACGLRTTDGVRIDRRVAGDLGDEPDVRRLPSGPRDGASPEETVRGFIGATAASASPGHPIAREFLTEPDGWDDGDGAVVFDPSTLTIRTVGVGRPARTVVRMRAARLGTLAADGAFRPTAGRADVDFGVRRVGGQWRLDRPPPGLLLTPRDLARGYRHLTRYLVAPEGDVLVGDPVYLVATRTTVANVAVRSLLQGPGEWLAPAVTTAAPRGLGLLNRVVVQDGVATVDLDRSAFTVPAERRPQLAGQLAATLGTTVDVDRVRILAEGRPYLEGRPELVAALPDGSSPAVDGPSYAVSPGGDLFAVEPPGVPTGPGSPSALVPVAGAPSGLLTAVADPSGSGTVAALQAAGPSRRLLLGPLGRLRPVTLPGVPVTGPTWVPGSGVVVAAAGRLLRVDLAGRVSTVAPPTFGFLGPVRDVAVSPDGTRLAVRTGAVVPDARGPGAVPDTVWVARLTRARGAVTAEAWFPVATGVAATSGIAWTGPLELALVGRSSGSTRQQVWTVDLGGLAGPVRLAVAGLSGELRTVTAAPGRDPMVVAGGELLRLEGARWVDLGAVRSAAHPH